LEANNILFRASGLGQLMTEPRSKSEILSETAKTHLVDIYCSYHYGRREEITSKFLEKGNVREPNSLTLLSRKTGKFLKQNETHLKNDYIMGTPDTYIGESINKADEIFDTKTAWSLHTFMRAKFGKLNADYFYQGHAYMWLTGAQKHTVAYCLVNGTYEAIEDEKRRLQYKPGMVDDFGNESEKFISQKKQIEVNHIFSLEEFNREYPHFQFDNDIAFWDKDIDWKERIFLIEIPRDEQIIENIKTKITAAREWMHNNLFK